MRGALFVVAAATFLTLSFSPAGAATPPVSQVWFNMTNYKAQPGVDGPQGWNKMFGDPHTPLPDFMDHVDVLAAAGVGQIPDELLANAFVKLKQKRVPFAIESLAQSWVHEPQCGHGVESYYDPPGARKVAEKIKAAGGELAYIAMDEPLFFGRYYDGPNACHSSIENVVERAVAIMVEYKKVFPQVVIGDIEPIPAIAARPGWQSEYQQWRTQFAQAMGQQLAFLHIDISWARPDWPAKLKETVAFCRNQKLPFGIIYNGNVHGDPTATNEKWLNSAVQNFQQIENRMGIVPEQVIFHSWAKFPPHSISDSSGLGEDYLVRQYVKSRTNR